MKKISQVLGLAECAFVYTTALPLILLLSSCVLVQKECSQHNNWVHLNITKEI